MSLQINTNPFPQYAVRRLESSPVQAADALQRVSAASNIERASGPSVIVELGLRALPQFAGLSSLSAPTSSRVSLLQTANGALNSVKNDLLQLRELAAEASNATRSQSQRDILQATANQLVADIDRISRQSRYQGVQIFDQSAGNLTGDPSMVAILDGLKGRWLENAENLIQAYFGLRADGAALNIDLTGFTDGPYGVAARVTATAPFYDSGKGSNLRLQLDRADFLPATKPNGGTAPLYSDRIIAHELTHAVLARTSNYANLARNSLWFVEGIAEFIHGGDERFAYDLAQAGGNVQTVINSINDGALSASIDYSASYAAVRYLHDQIKSAGGEGVKDIMDYLSTHQSATLDNAFSDAIAPLGTAVSSYTSSRAFLSDFNASGAAFIAANFDLSNTDTGAIGGLDADGGAVRTAASVVPDTDIRSGNNVLMGFAERFENIAATRSRSANSIQTDAYASTNRKAVVGAMNASALGINALNLLEDPVDAISQADRALQYVNTEQSRIAAQLNGFDSMFASLQTIFASLNSVRSWTLAPRSAAELATLAGSGILAQNETALLAQANVQQQIVAQLLMPG